MRWQPGGLKPRGRRIAARWERAARPLRPPACPAPHLPRCKAQRSAASAAASSRHRRRHRRRRRSSSSMRSRCGSGRGSARPPLLPLPPAPRGAGASEEPGSCYGTVAGALASSYPPSWLPVEKTLTSSSSLRPISRRIALRLMSLALVAGSSAARGQSAPRGGLPC